MEKITFIFYSSIRSLLVISSVHRSQCLAILLQRELSLWSDLLLGFIIGPNVLRPLRKAATQITT